MRAEEWALGCVGGRSARLACDAATKTRLRDSIGLRFRRRRDRWKSGCSSGAVSVCVVSWSLLPASLCSCYFPSGFLLRSVSAGRHSCRGAGEGDRMARGWSVRSVRRVAGLKAGLYVAVDVLGRTWSGEWSGLQGRRGASLLWESRKPSTTAVPFACRAASSLDGGAQEDGRQTGATSVAWRAWLGLGVRAVELE